MLVGLVLLLACAACDSAPAAPPRPTVDLTGVDPCTLLTAEQRTALGLDWTPDSGSSYSVFYDADVPSCVDFNSKAEVNVLVALVENTGIERYDDKTLLVATEKLPDTRLPALLIRPTKYDTDCSVVISTGPGHLIDVTAGKGSQKVPPPPQQALCDTARRAADAVVTTLGPQFAIAN